MVASWQIAAGMSPQACGQWVRMPENAAADHEKVACGAASDLRYLQRADHRRVLRVELILWREVAVDARSQSMLSGDDRRCGRDPVSRQAVLSCGSRLTLRFSTRNYLFCGGARLDRALMAVAFINVIYKIEDCATRCGRRPGVG